MASIGEGRISWRQKTRSLDSHRTRPVPLISKKTCNQHTQPSYCDVHLKVAFFHLFVKLFTVVSVGPISALVHCYTLTNKLNIFLGLFPSKEDHIDLCTIYILIYGVSLCIDIHITICNALPQTDAATDKPFLKCILSWSPLKQCIPVCLRSSVIDSDSAPLHRPIPSPGHWRWRA